MPKTSGEKNLPVARSQVVYWVIAVLLAFIAGQLWNGSSEPALPTALAQGAPLAGARGVYAFSGQIDRDTWGLVMLDIEQGTIWCYELDEIDGVRKLRLIAARSWLYDRYLRDFNCVFPNYREVQDLVAQQRTPTTSGRDVDVESKKADHKQGE